MRNLCFVGVDRDDVIDQFGRALGARGSLWKRSRPEPAKRPSEMPAPVKVQTPKPAGLDASAAAAEGRGSVVRLERNCSMARMLDIFSDAWSILILREAFFGAKTFEAFRS